MERHSIFTRHREKGPSPTLIAVSCAAYFLGAAGIGQLDTGFLLLAWLMLGFLAIAVYLTLDAHGSLLNAYTLFFATLVGMSLGGFALTA